MNSNKLMFVMSVAISLASTTIAADAHASNAMPFPTASASAPKSLAPGYALFQNNRFGFSMAYPKKVLCPRGVAGAAGETFVSKDGKAELCAFGQYNSMDQSLGAMLESDINLEGDGGKKVQVTDKQVGENWYQVSGTVDNDVFYIKSVLTGDNRVNKFIFHYPIAQRAKYDSIVTEVEKSFVAAPDDYLSFGN